MDVSGALMSGTDGLVSVSSDGSALFPSSLFSLQSEPSKQRGLYGSGFYKHGRSINGVEGSDEWSRVKMAKGDSMVTATSKPAACLFSRSGSHSIFPADGPQMLSFSSWKPDTAQLNDEWTSPFFDQSLPFSTSSASPYLRNAGLMGSGNSNLAVNGVVTGIRGPFTHSQWFELEHQALIYKYIDAKVPVPSNLLLPIRRPINPSVYPSSFTAGSYKAAGSLGWGPLHLGFSGSADPEPGRCRRTDGKKWRCSRDAVSDQKYCERHMNRGRHRSRKRVEGHSGHAARETLPAIKPSQLASAVSSGGSSNNLSNAQLQSKALQPSFTYPSSVQLDRSLMNKENRIEISQGLSTLTDLSSKSRGSLIPIPKQQNLFEDASTRVDFGLISTDSLLNSCGNYSSENLSFAYPNPEVTDQHTRSHPLRHFIDDWSKNSATDRTELSISIPMASPDFSSSSSSPNQDKMSFSPLRLSCDGRQRGSCSSWIPISWEPTIGGPLGEVLTNTSSTPKDLSRNLSSSSLNLLTNGWNSGTRFESSPTDVLHKSGFCSLSSSARSSPRAENYSTHTHESDELLGSINPC